MSDSKKKRSVTSGGRKKRRMTDGTNKEYECDVCEKRFTNFVKDEHTKQSTCNKCDEKFSNSKELMKHIARQHGNDGTYQCRLCQELESTEPTGVRYRDYFMVGECVQFLFTSCEGSLNERVSAANE